MRLQIDLESSCDSMILKKSIETKTGLKLRYCKYIPNYTHEFKRIFNQLYDATTDNLFTKTLD